MKTQDVTREQAKRICILEASFPNTIFNWEISECRDFAQAQVSANLKIQVNKDGHSRFVIRPRLTGSSLVF